MYTYMCISICAHTHTHIYTHPPTHVYIYIYVYIYILTIDSAPGKSRAENMGVIPSPSSSSPPLPSGMQKE